MPYTPKTWANGNAVDAVELNRMESGIQEAKAAGTAAGTAAVPTTRNIATGTGLTGGGTLAADKTLAVDFATAGVTTAGKVVNANDARLSDARTPTAHGHTITSADLVGSSAIGRSILTATDAAAVLSLTGAAGLDTDARLFEAELPLSVETIVSDYEAGLLGGGLAAREVFSWSASQNNFTVVASEPILLPEACTLYPGPAAVLAPDPGSTDTTYTIETATTPAGPWTDRYSGATKPTIPAGQSYAQAAAAFVQAVTAGTWLRVRTLTMPPGPAGSVTAANQSATATTYNSATSSLGTHTGPARPAGATGDIVMMLVSTNAANAVTLNAAWSVAGGNVSSTATPRAGLTVAFAPWSSGLVMQFTVAPSAPALAAAFLISSASLSTPVVDLNLPVGSNSTTGGAIATPVGSSTAAGDLTYQFAATWYATNIDNYHLTPSSGPAGLVELVDETTSRSALTNFGLWVGRAPGPSGAGVSVPATTLTFAGGTGVTSGVGYVTGFLTIRRAASTPGPTDLTVQIFYKKG